MRMRWFLAFACLLSTPLAAQFRYVPSRGDLTVVGQYTIGGRFTLHMPADPPRVDTLFVGPPTHVVLCPYPHAVLRVVPEIVLPFSNSYTVWIPNNPTLVGGVIAFEVWRRDRQKRGCASWELSNAVVLTVGS